MTFKMGCTKLIIICEVVILFIIRCTCGEEVYCANELVRTAWKCTECGQWLDSCGYPVREPEDAAEYESLNCMELDMVGF